MDATSKDISAKSHPAKRLRGRPRRLSPEAIVETTLKMLETRPLDEITMVTVADAVGASVMGLYKYFPNRDALFEAVSARCFALFQPPQQDDADLRTSLLAWLWALQRHFDRFPVVQKMIGWEGRIPAAWLRVVVPVIRLLREQGLKGPTLALACEYFFSAAHGLMTIESVAPIYRNKLPLHAVDQLSEDDQALMLELQPYRKQLKRDELLDYGFRRLIDGLYFLLPQGEKPARKA